MNPIPFLLILALFFLPLPQETWGQIYRSKSKDGTISFSDNPTSSVLKKDPAESPGSKIKADELKSDSGASVDRESLVKKYIELSGIDKVLSTIPDHVDAVCAQRSLVSKNPELEENIVRLFKESYNIPLAKKNFYSFVLNKSDISFLHKIISWMETPLAQKIKNEEFSSSGPESQADLLRYTADLQRTPPSKVRIAIIQNVEKTTRLSELALNMNIEIMRGMFESINLTLPEGKREPMVNIEKEISKIRPIIQESLRRQMILLSFYVYRNISDDELNKYIDFYQSETGKTELTIMNKAIVHVLKQWSVVSFGKIITFLKGRLENKK